LSNELRNSMNGVMGLIGLLKDSELTSEQLEYTVSLEKSVDNLMYTVNDALDHYKIQANDITFQGNAFVLLNNDVF
jgi:signal transduction histidine kinase